MTLEEDTGVDGVELTSASQIEVVDDSIEDVMKMVMACLASIQIVKSRNTVIIVNILPD